MHRSRLSLPDLSLGLMTFLVIGLLLTGLRAGWTPDLKVLAQSAVIDVGCGNGSVDSGEECDGGTKFEDGLYYRCTSCRWEQQTVDPIVDTNDSFCCLSNGRTARCTRLYLNQPCLATAQETDVKLFSTYSNNQTSCEDQRRSGRCNDLPESSASSSSAASSVSSTWCGDNVKQSNEECDWGGNNSDTLPNRCRKDCTYPTCGNGHVDDNFNDPVSGKTINEECDNIEYVLEGTSYPAVSDLQWAWNSHEYCSNDCTIKETTTTSIFFMFPRAVETPLYIVRPIFDWNSIFFPFSSLGF